MVLEINYPNAHCFERHYKWEKHMPEGRGDVERTPRGAWRYERGRIAGIKCRIELIDHNLLPVERRCVRAKQQRNGNRRKLARDPSTRCLECYDLRCMTQTEAFHGDYINAIVFRSIFLNGFPNGADKCFPSHQSIKLG